MAAILVCFLLRSVWGISITNQSKDTLERTSDSESFCVTNGF